MVKNKFLFLIVVLLVFGFISAYGASTVTGKPQQKVNVGTILPSKNSPSQTNGSEYKFIIDSSLKQAGFLNFIELSYPLDSADNGYIMYYLLNVLPAISNTDKQDIEIIEIL